MAQASGNGGHAVQSEGVKDADRMKRQMVHTPPRTSALSPLTAGAAAGSCEKWETNEAVAESERRHRVSEEPPHI